MAKNIQTKVYRIDKSLFPDQTSEEIIDNIIANYGRRTFTLQPLDDEFDFGNFEVAVYYSPKQQGAIPPWRDFLAPVVAEGANILSAKNFDAAFVTFFYSDNNIFAIAGGIGSFVVQEYIDKEFGFQIISRLIRNNDEAIKHLQDRGVTGSVLASTKSFRKSSRLSDEEDFGRIYKEIRALLTTEITRETFGIESRKDANCIARGYFQLKKSLSVDGLLNLLGRIETVLQRDPVLRLNRITLIERHGRNKELLKRLNNLLQNELYTIFHRQNDNDFDFCHYDFDTYMVADRIRILNGRNLIVEFDTPPTSLKAIFEEEDLRNHLNTTDRPAFSEAIATLIVECVDEEGRSTQPDSFIKHLHGEMKDPENNIYFYMDAQWYRVGEDYLTALHNDCQTTVNEYEDSTLLLERWANTEDEFAYNRKYLVRNADGYFMLDRVKPQFMEFCDIFLQRGENLYLFHVKKGLDVSTREVAGQITIAARNLHEDLANSQHPYLKALYAAAQANQIAGPQFNGENEASFINRFIRKKDNIYFCLAFVSTIQELRNIRADLIRLRSNIAKFSIIEARKNVRQFGFHFRICQVAN